MRTWKVGELAKQTGLTVRTLHHYDQIGLLSPSHRTAAGHRLYGEVDVGRLQQIVSLRSLGFALDDVRAVLRDGMAPLEVVRMHAARLREQIHAQQRLADRLDRVAAGLEHAHRVSPDELIHTIEEITRMEQYYTPEQMEYLNQRREIVGEARIREVEAEWPRLMDEVRAEMQAGTDPADPRVQELARRWMGLLAEFTGGDPGIARSASAVWENETEVQGINAAEMREIMGYIGRAKAAGSAS
ncbi:MAG TPA: MerR family transcriptional regulator [Longimicrobium sp.]|uniref:MerR family transcriptional regulator n=1 Tax=Longimicrobium sp. TaxID=2029185 RepID=UPI002ED78CCE